MTGTRLLTSSFRKYNGLRRVLVLAGLEKRIQPIVKDFRYSRRKKVSFNVFTILPFVFPQLPSAACLQLRFPLRMTYLQSCYNWKAKLNNCRVSKYLFQWEKYLQCHLREARDPLFIRDFRLFFLSLVQQSNRRVPYLPTPLSDQVWNLDITNGHRDSKVGFNGVWIVIVRFLRLVIASEISANETTPIVSCRQAFAKEITPHVSTNRALLTGTCVNAFSRERNLRQPDLTNCQVFRIFIPATPFALRLIGSCCLTAPVLIG